MLSQFRAGSFIGTGAWKWCHSSAGILGGRLQWQERNVADGSMPDRLDLRIVGRHLLRTIKDRVISISDKSVKSNM